MKSYQPNSINNLHKISVAPMMDCTDKHFRMIMRKISSKALLYTEMIVAQSLIYTENKEKFLNFNSEEHPLSIQFGGDNPQILKEAAKMAEDWGYDEINFNLGSYIIASSKIKKNFILINTFLGSVFYYIFLYLIIWNV